MKDYLKGIKHGKAIALATIIHWLEALDENKGILEQDAKIIAQAIKEEIYKARD